MQLAPSPHKHDITRLDYLHAWPIYQKNNKKSNDPITIYQKCCKVQIKSDNTLKILNNKITITKIINK